MNEYKNGKIYKITDSKNEMLYIGSTIQPLIYRFRLHVSSFKANANKSSARHIFAKYGVANCSIHLIEEYPCNSREELSRREGAVIVNMRNTIQSIVNKNIAGRTRKEWMADNKAKVKEYHKQYDKLLYIKKKALKEQAKQSKLTEAQAEAQADEQQLQILISIIDNTPDNIIDIIIN